MLSVNCVRLRLKNVTEQWHKTWNRMDCWIPNDRRLNFCKNITKYRERKIHEDSWHTVVVANLILDIWNLFFNSNIRLNRWKRWGALIFAYNSGIGTGISIPTAWTLCWWREGPPANTNRSLFFHPVWNSATWRIIPSSKWLITMAIVSLLRIGLFPFQMGVSWLINGGDPN